MITIEATGAELRRNKFVNAMREIKEACIAGHCFDCPIAVSCIHYFDEEPHAWKVEDTT